MVLFTWTKTIGLEEDFFTLGGDSLIAAQVLTSNISKPWYSSSTIPIFLITTISGLALFISSSSIPEEKNSVTIPKRKQTEFIPLSFAQQRLWFIDQLEPGNAQYNIPITLRLRGHLNIKALHQAINFIAARHEVLRTVFQLGESGEPIQVISSELNVVIEELSFTEDVYPDLTFSMRELKAKSALHSAVHQGFDLSRGPLIRATLFQLSKAPAEESLFLLNIHHSVADGWSLSILAQELGTAYQAYAHGFTPNLPNLEIQYADFSLWQREYLKEEGDAYQQQMNYWQKQLVNIPSLLELPTDRGRPTVFSPKEDE